MLQINKHLPKDCIIINEGSTTMDIGRTVLLSRYPRRRYVHWGTDLLLAGVMGSDPGAWEDWTSCWGMVLISAHQQEICLQMPDLNSAPT